MSCSDPIQFVPKFVPSSSQTPDGHPRSQFVPSSPSPTGDELTRAPTSSVPQIVPNPARSTTDNLMGAGS